MSARRAVSADQIPILDRIEMPYKENLLASMPGSRGVCQDGKEPKDIPGTDRGGSVDSLLNDKLRARLKHDYYRSKQESYGEDLKDFWNSCVYMFPVKDLKPAVRFPSQVCNKPTMLYWNVSAQLPGPNACPSIIFACIYKCWYRYHDNDPDLKFGKFFAQPFRITQTGPHTIPGILEVHAHLYNRAISDLESIKRSAESCPDKRSGWENFNLLPLSRAIIVLLDEPCSPPVFKVNRTVSLDDEVQRRTAVLVLTGFDQDLSCALSFDSIRSNALPLARNDVEATDSNVIRVSLKTAVHFIAELQQREERAVSDRRGELTATKPESANKDHGSTMAKQADEYAEDILANASTDPSKARLLGDAMEVVELIDSGRMNPDWQFLHWNPRYI